jgi:hypothetical protein
MPDRSFHVDSQGFVYKPIIESSKDGLSAKCMGSTNGGNNFFSEITALSNVLER